MHKMGKGKAKGMIVGVREELLMWRWHDERLSYRKSSRIYGFRIIHLCVSRDEIISKRHVHTFERDIEAASLESNELFTSQRIFSCICSVLFIEAFWARSSSWPR